MITFADVPYKNSTLYWMYNETTDSVRYVIYAVPNTQRNEPNAFSKGENVVGISFGKSFKLPTGISTSRYKLAVSVMDRYGNEFAPRVLGENLDTEGTASLSFPAEGAGLKLPVIFQWSAVEKADNYVIQVARDPEFTDIVFARETLTNQFGSGSQLNLKDDSGQYYWRVRTRKANALDTWSETRSFTLSTTASTEDITSNPFQAYIYERCLFVAIDKPSPASIRLYSAAGQLLSSSEIRLQGGENTIALPGKALSTGIALVNIRTNQGEMTLKANL
jgi:hypothetical protein